MDIMSRFCRYLEQKITRWRLSRLSNGKTNGMSSVELARWRIKNDPSFQPTEQDLSELVSDITDKLNKVLEMRVNDICN